MGEGEVGGEDLCAMLETGQTGRGHSESSATELDVCDLGVGF